MKKSGIWLLAVLAAGLSSCSIFQTLENITRLQFKLNTVNNFNLNGIAISNKSQLKDFSPQDLLKISSAISRGTLPVSFTLNINAKNPNDGTGGYPRTDATIKSFPWRLLINDKETISGNIASSIFVPGTGEETTFPLSINLDLMKSFKDRSLEEIINLALNIGGYGGSPSNLAVYARPTVTSPLGDITYPQELKIVDVQYTK
jgi:hypothetical protein